MNNIYTTCTYNELDTNNPFSSCNTGSESQNYRNNLAFGISRNNFKDSHTLYTNETNYLTSNGSSQISNPGTLTDSLNSIINKSTNNDSKWDYNEAMNYLAMDSKEVNQKRRQLDAKLSRMNSVKNMDNNDDSTFLYNSAFYVNMLWIILATSLIYYIFTEM